MLINIGLFDRQKPMLGKRYNRAITGGFWLPHNQCKGSVPDTTGQNPPAKIIGGVMFCDGPFNSPALRLNGSTGYIDCGLNGATTFNWSNINNPIARTFGCWFRYPVGGGGPIFAKGNNVINSGWNLSVADGQGISVGFIGSFNTKISFGNFPSHNVWHQLCVLWNGRNTTTGNILIYIYLDGVLVYHSIVLTTVIGDQNVADIFNLWIGHATYISGTGGAASAYFTGDIDHWFYDQRFYSPEEIKALYFKPFQGFRSITLPPSPFPDVLPPTNTAPQVMINN